MKNIFKLFLLSFVMVFTACDEDLDINTDPTSPSDINKGLAIASGEASIMTVTGGVLTNLGGFWAQYHTQSPSASQYESIDQYNIDRTFANRMWTEIYAGGLNDIQYALDKANADGDTGTALIATALKAYTFQLLVDIFDAVPYAEALQGTTNITPAPTPGDEIYADLLVKLDEAVAAYEANPVPSEIGKQDMIYNASMGDWIKFINTLKLKMYLRMAYTPMANPAAVNALLAEDNFITTDAAFTNFGESLNQRNPFYEVQIANTGLGDVNNVASNTLHNFYINNGDPRVTAAYRYRPSDSTYVSIKQGTGNDFNDTAKDYARPNIGPSTPVFLITVTESNFLQAEALIRYSGGTGAKAKYDQGIVESFKLYQTYYTILTLNDDDEYVPDTTTPLALATPFIEAGGEYEYQPQADTESTVRQVIIQKWAALAFVNNIEAYIETTRTKFPEVVPDGTQDYTIGNRIPSDISVLPGTQVPSIIYYADDEINRNPNLTQHGSLTEKVWWDQKP